MCLANAAHRDLDSHQFFLELLFLKKYLLSYYKNCISKKAYFMCCLCPDQLLIIPFRRRGEFPHGNRRPSIMMALLTFDINLIQTIEKTGLEKTDIFSIQALWNIVDTIWYIELRLTYWVCKTFIFLNCTKVTLTQYVSKFSQI